MKELVTRCDHCETVRGPLKKYRVSIAEVIKDNGLEDVMTEDVDLCEKGLLRAKHFVNRGTHKVGWKPDQE